MELPFIKMEGIGNDYIFIDQEIVRAKTDELSDIKLIQGMCNRHYGIGSDGLVLIQKAQNPQAQARMQMWNADGSSSSMCGNALRCIALYTYQKTQKTKFLLESPTGTHECEILESDPNQHQARIKVNMGPPEFRPERIPFLATEQTPQINIKLDSHASQIFAASIISMGNPHCVIFTEDADKVDLEHWGPIIESHPQFPQRTNVEFVSIKSNGELYQRTYERGSGETLACGSGACAVGVAGVLTGRGQANQIIQLRGGELGFEWSGSLTRKADVFLSGNARMVFTGTWPR